MTIDDKSMDALDAHFRQWQRIAEQLRAQVTPALKVQETLEKSLGPLVEAQEDFERQWQQIAEQLTAEVTPALKVQEELQKSLEPLVEAHKAYGKALEPILSEQNRWRELTESVKVPHFDLPDFSLLTKQASEFQELLQGLITPAFEQLERSFRELPPRTQEALLLLGEHGWYMDLEMSVPELREFEKALSDGNVEEAEDALAEYFEGRLEEIEKSISERFPRRAHLIRAAFNAHRRQEYELSIPVLLAQTDGICRELVNQYLFIKQNKKPGTAIYVDQVAADTFRAALLSPLAKTLPINASERERPAGFDALNRHTVLHGESLDYGSKINSLKAISLVNYVAQVLQVEKENP
jgi:hypothetical protein